MKEIPKVDFPGYIIRDNKRYYLIGPIPASVDFQKAFDSLFRGYQRPKPTDGSVMDVKAEMISPSLGRFSCLCVRGDFDGWLVLLDDFADRWNAKVWQIRGDVLILAHLEGPALPISDFVHFDCV
jgi:hypothetical protein